MCKGVAAIVLAILVAGVVMAIAPATVVLAEKPLVNSGSEPVAKDGEVEAAQAFVNRIKEHVSRILELAEEYNMTLPGGLGERVQLARQLLENATQLLEQGRAREAVRLALRASLALRPIAENVIRGIPESASTKVAVQGLSRAIELREEVVRRLNRTIEWLEERGLDIPSRIEEAVDNASKLLEVAREELSKGNISVAARLLSEASRLLGLANAWLSEYTGRLWARIAVAEGAVRRFAAQILVLLRHFNKSIDMLEANATDDALFVLTASQRILQSLERYLERAKEIVATGEDCDAAATLETMLDAVENAAIYADAGIAALEEDDVVGAVENVKEAYSTLTTALEGVGGKLRAAAIALHGFKRRIGMLKLSLDARIKNLIERRIALFADKMLRDIAMEVRRVLAMVRSGRISRDDAIEKLMRLKQTVEELMKKLRSREEVPMQLKERARILRETIERAIDELSTGPSTVTAVSTTSHEHR